MFGGQGGGSNAPPFPFGQPSTTSSTTGGVFGQPVTTQVGTFGQAATTSTTMFESGQFQTSGVFGSVSSIQQATTSVPAFGPPITSATPFGPPITSATPFGPPITSATPFGQPSTSAAALFAGTSASSLTPFGRSSGETSGVFGQVNMFGVSSSAPVSTNSQVAFSQPPSSASSAFGAPSTSSTGSFGAGASTGGVFGNTISSSGSFTQPPVFSVTAGSPFGSVGGFGTKFGEVSSSSMTSSFGAATTPAGAFGSSTTASGAFGALTPATGTFGEPKVSSAAFGSVATTTSAVGAFATSSAFGSYTSTTSAFGSTGVIGGPTTTSAQNPFGATADSIRSMFAAESREPVVSEPPPVLFGKSSIKEEPPTVWFGKPAFKDDSTPGLFGRPASKEVPPAVLFGKPAAKPEPSSGLFGKPSEKTETSTTLFGTTKLEPPAAVVGNTAGKTKMPSALFGKSSDKPDSQASLFGKSTTKVEQPTALFGKLVSSAVQKASDKPAGLFGKDDSVFTEPSTCSPPKSVFAHPGDSPQGKRTATTMDSTRRALIRTGLFGKPAADGQQWIRPAADPGSPKKVSPRLERLNSAEERQELTSLLCTEVPEGYNDREILRAHFSKFGTVVRVGCNKRDHTASVKFADHASAEAAKKRGMKVHPKLPPMSLYFRRAVKQGDGAVPHRPPLSDDVAEELRAMAETGAQSGQSEYRLSQKPKLRLKPKPAAGAASSVASAGGEPAVAASLSVAELRAVLRQSASTAVQRFRLLDARDKLQRAELRREPPTRSGPLVGTCSDMCPEKERYMREEKHQITSYERDRSGMGAFEMDHRLAVKQYSRSSADQEEPLPQELRTPAALLRTMDYLVTHVTDAESADTGDWYHFIWDRTRGIRKDITQQQLTDAISVGLVEKCARFHVHCASALGQLPLDMFDQKINNENLTKCLQTLKHMYHDLSLKNVQCPREAEFRAYDILLNLNQGDTLREVQTYSEPVRASAPVQAALQIYLALSSNNYVRFFKLVRRADYLSSCLLQRYFAQVRTRALDTITLAFCPPKKLVEFPLSELRLTLGFESEAECAMFLRLHGLESEEGTAFLDRALFCSPDVAPPLRRCPTLIDAKRTTPIGEVIQGGPLPEDPLPSYTPHCSFDEQGMLRRSAWEALDQKRAGAPSGVAEGALERGVSHSERAQQAPRAVPVAVAELLRPPTPKPDTTNAVALQSALSSTTSDLLHEVVDAETRQLCTDQMTVERVVQSEAVQICADMVPDVAGVMAREVCQCIIQELEEEKQQEARDMERQLVQQRRDDEIKARLSVVLTDMLVAEVCLDETNDIALDEMKRVDEDRDELLRNRVAEFTCAQLCAAEADRLAWETAVEAVQSELRQRQARLQAAAEIGRRLTLRHLLTRWRETAAADRRLRERLRAFPVSAPLHDEEQTLMLMGGAGEMPHPSSDSATDASLCRVLLEDRLHTAPVLLSTLLSSTGEKLPSPRKIQLVSPRKKQAPSPRKKHASSTVGKLNSFLRGETQTSTPWKIALLAQPPGEPLSDWLQYKLTDREVGEDDFNSGVLQRGIITTAPLQQHPCAVRCCRSPDDAVGSGGLITTYHRAADAARLLPLLRRLRREPLLPLAVLTTTSRSAEAVGRLELISMAERGPLATYRVFELDGEDALGSGETLATAVEWLFAHRAGTPALRGAPLRHLIQDFVALEVTAPLYDDLHHRRGRRRVEQRPEAAVALYNAAVRHLAVVLSSSSLPELSWPPAELLPTPPPDWNTTERLLMLKQKVENLVLPCLDLEDDWDWVDGCAHVLEYVRGLATPGRDCTPLLCRVRCLLEARMAELQETAWPQHQHLETRPIAGCLPWTDIVQCCIELRTSSVSDKEIVYCLPDELANFRVPQLWADLTSTAQTSASLGLDESVANAKRPLEISVDQTASKRRQEKSSFQPSTLDVTAELSREMDVSLDWEERLREIVDQGDRCEEGLPSSISRPDRGRGLLTPRRPTAQRPPLATSRLRADPPPKASPLRSPPLLDYTSPTRVRLDGSVEELQRCGAAVPELEPVTSLVRRLGQLRDGLAEHRRGSGDFTRKLLLLSAEQDV